MNDFIDQWDDNEFPLAYFITIRTYGTWLHGNKRNSVDRHGKNIYGTPKREPNEKLEGIMKAKAKQKAFLLKVEQRELTEQSFNETCKARKYELLAVHARTNHVHAVISAAAKPEAIINGLKSHATRKLRKNFSVLKDEKVWSRGGSRRYLWKKRHVDLAIDYVLYGQGQLPLNSKTGRNVKVDERLDVEFLVVNRHTSSRSCFCLCLLSYSQSYGTASEQNPTQNFGRIHRSGAFGWRKSAA